MLFSSNVFLFRFLPVVLAGYYILFRGMRRQQNLFLLLSSLFFYAWGEWRFLPLMLLSIAMKPVAFPPFPIERLEELAGD